MSHPQYPLPYPQPPRKSRTALWIVLGVVGFFILLCGGCAGIIATSADDAGSSSSSVASGSGTDGEDVAPAGSEVRDGKFAFVVTQVEPPVKSVGGNYLSKAAQGEFVLIHIDVTNTSDQPQSYFGSNQKLIDTQGREFTNDTEAEIYVNDDVHTDINPGNKFSVILAFDVPVGTVPAALEFHDSMFSGGVRVAVG
ncbi:DUF4352 domain-containing protein [Nocardia cyriacigeorgica]|uniref:DUF4352 domain-containing protein n=1 Tax=Nocardia cyriacigeorgica TaxID=135487 RepID=UPI001893186B|nr:DUF4352 domain-containing protein [Nocardia cyriacigeorgica]MBF6455556.1 DUF4352 domain-containing protein [Nocardia cyriacigeorgica]MBF6477413.1 DUF4352 domain-containing protein [Nocardia cyriacigeorgica]MBF6553702.1 DUF4352 domain-containing protein [Nocardia cyriacigeorgica]